MSSSIVPRAIRKGETIAFISPSARANDIFAGPLARAQSYLEQQGYRVKIIFDGSEAVSFKDSILQRCEEIHSAFRDPDIKAIICTIGGSHTNELLRFLDYDLIRANPKIFCGLSDITVLHYALFTQTGLRTFYGPNAITELGDYPEPLAFTADHFLRVIQAETARTPIGPLPRASGWAPKLPAFATDPTVEVARDMVSPCPNWTWLRVGQARGRIFGGCLDSIQHLAGTRFWPDYRGRILLLETSIGDKMGDPYPMERARADMADLANLGVLEAISGLVVGRPFGYDEKMQAEFAKMIVDQCFGTHFPILLGLDVGHTDPVLTIPLDAMASLDSEMDEFNVLEAVVSSG